MTRWLLLPPVLSVLLVFSGLAATASAEWPLYGGDAARSGVTQGSLPDRLVPAWSYQPTHPPRPAWPRDARMVFDRAFYPVVADGVVIFGSSADGKITALEADSGQVRWTFFTEGPVRVAPAVWKDRVFIGSDDGNLYSLAVRDGTLLKKWRAGPEEQRVLGNERIVSRWPVRGGPVVFEDTVYFAAGIWQAEGIHLYALDPETGEMRWHNDHSGSMMMPQPHGGANANSGVTAQGHLVATDEHLFVPTGRAVPAAFRRQSGEFLYYHLQKNGKFGGSHALAEGPLLLNVGAGYKGNAFLAEDGERLLGLPAGAYAALPDGLLAANGRQLQRLKRIEKETTDRLGKPIRKPAYETAWTLSDIPGGSALIVAGTTAISAGPGKIVTVDLKEQQLRDSHAIEGMPCGLAASQGRLYVSTDRGTLHCFAAKAPPGGDRRIAESDEAEHSYGKDGKDSRFAAAAEAIVARTGVTEGYCVDLGCGDGSLAYELARRTDLHIVAVDNDPKQVAEARRQLAAAGLYGARVTVFQADQSQTRFPRYFANLVVSARSVVEGPESVSESELQRLQRPYGGAACLGPTNELNFAVRGALPNAGDWTHQYTNPANTGCSTDELIAAPLRVLWYRDVDLDVPQRHGRGPAPLFHDGRLFVMGMDALRAVDAYNGRSLWQFDRPGVLHAYDADHLMGTAGTGSNFCAAGDSVYFRHQEKCYRIDAETGRVLKTFLVPEDPDGQQGTWGHIAVENGILFGSVINEDHIVRHSWRPADEQMKQLFTESRSLFAYDVESGKLKWRYDAEASIRHNAIAIGNGHVFLIDRPLALNDRLDAARRLGKNTGKGSESPEHPTGTLVALDGDSGQIRWSNEHDIFGTLLAYSEPHDRLLMSYQPTRFKLPSEKGGRLAVFNSTGGDLVWQKQAKYVTRPIINDDTLYAQGGAWDLLTGEDMPFDFNRSYGCGQLSGCKNLMLFRSATLSYFDVSSEGKDPKDKEPQDRGGVTDFGGIRPGCWINAIAAGGLVLVPDASAGCSCSYQNRAWVALEGVGNGK